MVIMCRQIDLLNISLHLETADCSDKSPRECLLLCSENRHFFWAIREVRMRENRKTEFRILGVHGISMAAAALVKRIVFGGARRPFWRELRCSSLSTASPNVSTSLASRSGQETASSRRSPTAFKKDKDPLSHPDFFGVEAMTNVRQLLEARIHLGHKRGAWDPRMKPYLFGTRAGIHIFDLDKTLFHLRQALNVVGHVALRNGIILFMSERSQFELQVQKAARDCGEYFYTNKWLSGTFTNSQMLLGTTRLPDLVIYLSVPTSETAMKEAAMCNIPSVGIVDSDCNPNLLTYPIPGNDDTPTALKLYCSLFSRVISQAKTTAEKTREEEEGKPNNPSPTNPQLKTAASEPSTTTTES